MGVARRCVHYYCCYLVVPVLLAIVSHIVIRTLAQGMDRWGGVPRTLEEETAMCPNWVMTALRWKVDKAIRGHQMLWGSAYLPEDVAFHANWAGDYTVAFYITGQALLKFYNPRHADSVNVPTISASPPSFRVGSIMAPDLDIDDPIYWPLERLVPRPLWRTFFPTINNCLQGVLREFPFEDLMENNKSNSWDTLLHKDKRKRDFILSFYDGHTLWDGKHPMYPQPENDFASLFLKADVWDDGLEKALAFDLIGAHRVEPATKVFGGETLSFKLALNSFSALEVRPNFARYGADMYFTVTGFPALIVTPDGRHIQRGDKDWQYWKFVWRSTLCSIVTLIDHLHLTHYRAANLAAQASRRSLPADHPARRVTAIYTFGSIFINNIAHHMLIGTRSPLHRATPFKNFDSLNTIIPHDLKPVENWHKPLLDETAWEQLPQLLKDAPYFADGRLLIGAMRKLWKGLFHTMANSVLSCNEENNFTLGDVHLIRYLLDVSNVEAISGYKATYEPSSWVAGLDCRVMHQKSLGFFWTLTGFHRHVGMVADFFADPDLAGFSWKNGESFARPKQATLMAVVAAVTGTPHPKINEDFSHLFAGVPGGQQMTKQWREFQEDLREVEDEVRRRNDKRRIKNYHADPSVVECSVAV